MPINEHWNIRSRAHACTHSNEPFTDGETFYTALFEDETTGELVRRDYSVESWDALRGELKPFSFWKSIYEAPRHEGKPEVVEKESAPGTENTRYILAVMLERKRILKQTATRETEDGEFLIYEQPKTGEVLIIRDPELRLDQVEAVQREVALMLGYGTKDTAPDAAVAGDIPGGEAGTADSEAAATAEPAAGT
jgi:hypothetical protein